MLNRFSNKVKVSHESPQRVCLAVLDEPVQVSYVNEHATVNPYGLNFPRRYDVLHGFLCTTQIRGGLFDGEQSGPDASGALLSQLSADVSGHALGQVLRSEQRRVGHE